MKSMKVKAIETKLMHGDVRRVIQGPTPVMENGNPK